MKKFFLLLSAALLLNVSGFCQNVNQLFNKINNEVRDTYAPDERDKTYEVALIDNKGKLTLVGSTTEKEAVDALLAKLSKAGIKAENKIDVLPYFDFDIEACKKYVRKLNPNMKIIPISARNGEGIDEWAQWLREQITAWNA